MMTRSYHVSLDILQQISTKRAHKRDSSSISSPSPLAKKLDAHPPSQSAFSISLTIVNRRFVTLSSLNIPRRLLKLLIPTSLAMLIIAMFFSLPQPSTQAAVTADFEADWVAPFQPSQLATADVNGDGYLDVAYILNGTPRLLLNNGGTLSISPDWEATDVSGARQLAFGDVDLDGDLDLAVAVNGSGDRIYLDQGDQLSTTSSWIASNNDDSIDIAWGDLNGDGWLDLVSGGNSSYRIYINNTAGFTEQSAVATPASRLALGDMNGDSLLDLAVSDSVGDVSVYTSTGSTFSSSAVWTHDTFDDQPSEIEWIDFNNDGLSDLSTHYHDGAAVSLYTYFNLGTVLTDTPNVIWSPNDLNVEKFDFGDVNSDGYIDILANTEPNNCATGVCPPYTLAILNNGGTGLSGTAFTNEFNTSSGVVKFADLNNDGLLDILTVYDYLRAYIETDTLSFASSEEFLDSGFAAPTAQDIALADIDNDGDLDVSISRSRLSGDGTTVHIMQDGTPTGTTIWSGPNSSALDWGDMNGDGHLDLALALNGNNIVYLNEGTSLTNTVSWTAADSVVSNDIAWADVDGDGDLDLSSADDAGVRLYENINGMLNPNAIWEITNSTNNNALAWSDIDQDGDLDLAVGADDLSFLILNDRGLLETTPAWTATGSEFMDWGDMDNDGDEDLALIGNGPAVVYINEGGLLNESHAWISLETELATSGIHWVDLNQDNYPELFVVNSVSHIYENVLGELDNSSGFEYTNLAVRLPILGTTADLDRDGDRDLLFYYSANLGIYVDFLVPHFSQLEQPVNAPDTNYQGAIKLGAFSNLANSFSGQSTTILAPSTGYGSSHIRSGIIPISYTTYTGVGDALEVRGSYSLNGGGDWQPAVATTNTITTHVSLDGSTNVYNWDVEASGFFGQSDNVVFRLELVNGGHGTNGRPPSIQRTSFVAETQPFRVRGTQIRVISGTTPMADAQIYRIPAGSTADAELVTNSAGEALLTNSSGYLQGRGEIGIGDTLYAIAPISSTVNYNVYYGSAIPTETGVNGTIVAELGEQILNVSADNPLILFKTTVSLEWDSRNDPAYLSKLEQNIERASEILFDATNGQIALGEVSVYQRKDNWAESHVAIAAANNIRPNATLGGVVTEPISDSLKASGIITDAYLPGQVRMGPVWSRFGDASADLGEDWARVLAHELGHYYLFLPDNYLGISNGALTSIDCNGSLMTNPYLDEYSEFLTRDNWTGDCLESVAELVSGRTDWETIIQYYPWLTDTKTLTGPTQLPINLTSVSFESYENEAKALAAPFFPLRDENDDPIRFDSGGSGYLIRNADTPSPLDDYIISLGTPIGDQMQARGAEPGDRLCVFDFNQATTRFGCQDVAETESEITLNEVADWQPQIDISALAITDTSQAVSYTIGIYVTVTQDTNEDMFVQIMPTAGFTQTFPIESVIDQLATNSGVNHTAFLTLSYPTQDIFVRVWEDGSGSSREAIVEHNLGAGWGGHRLAWGGHRLAWGGHRLAWGGHRLAWGAPAASSNGQVIVLNLEDVYGDTGTASLQELLVPPTLPSWLTAVGSAYDFEASAAYTRTISFNYLQSDVPGDGIYEEFLQIYYSADEGTTWTPLKTTLNTDNNLAAATMPYTNQGDGLYALISTIQMPNQAIGWNLFGYPVQESRPVTEALASVINDITTVYWFDTQADNWLIYDTTVPAPFDQLVNTLSQMDYGKGYWVYATQAITPYIGVENDRSGIFVRPMTVYGLVNESDSFTPTAGMEIVAYIGNTACGSGLLESIDGKLGYTLQVNANSTTGCGAEGSEVTFVIDNKNMSQSAIWSNRQALYLPFNATLSNHLYLPLVSTSLQDDSSVLIND